jgi:hypothetical protein
LAGFVYSLKKFTFADPERSASSGDTMSKGYAVSRERSELVNSFGKILGKRASFRCEWCDGTKDLRVWDSRPREEPRPETLALLCAECRAMADGKPAEDRLLHSLRTALWSDILAVAEGAARVLLKSRVPWVREAIEESLLDESVKRQLLG